MVEWDSSEVGFESDELPIESSELDAPIAKDDEDSDRPRRRRRRRGGRSSSRPETEVGEESPSDDTAGPQAYGRHAEDIDTDPDDEEVENVRMHRVTSWLDAITLMIDSNMENHKRNPGQDRGRGNQNRGNNNNSRRRGSGGGNSNNSSSR
ncbi:MAG: hypothetical protein SGI77_14340 [Pirellulaceae bacterium]|nr:hypothetical protein [Pirellulaceae bacterium]